MRTLSLCPARRGNEAASDAFSPGDRWAFQFIPSSPLSESEPVFSLGITLSGKLTCNLSTERSQAARESCRISLCIFSGLAAEEEARGWGSLYQDSWAMT